MRQPARLLLASLALAACAPTELLTPDAGSCDGLEGQNSWPWFASDAPIVNEDQLGFEIGETAPDFQLQDQHGDPVCLWQFSGKVVLVDASALWCEPCKDIAKHASCVADSFGDELVYLTFIGQNNDFQPAAFPDNQGWAEDYGLSEGELTPVVADGDQLFLRDAWVTSFPSFLLLDRDMSIVAKGEGRPGETAMRDAAEEILGEPTSDCVDEE